MNHDDNFALISVYDKTGIEDFAADLIGLGWRIMSSGGTAAYLRERGIETRDVADLVGGGAMLGHRVVTLSREIHAGLLSRDTEEDRAELARFGIPRIGLVCVDLYPLEAEISSPDSTPDSIIEKTDVGGPALLRSAAKGRRIVISAPAQRAVVLDWLRAGQPDERAFLDRLAAEAEERAGAYALLSASSRNSCGLRLVSGRLLHRLKYGENPWQKPAAVFAARDSGDPLRIAGFECVNRLELSYNNVADLDRLLQTMTHVAAVCLANFGAVPSIAIGAKHGNACGAAAADDAIAAVRRMAEGDARAIFGGVVMCNFRLTDRLADELLNHGMPEGKRRKLDMVIAPGFDGGARALLDRKGCRLMANPALGGEGAAELDRSRRIRHVRGGFMVQPNYEYVLDLDDAELTVFGEPPIEAARRDMALAWAIGATSNSNTVCLVKDGRLIGNGMGQMDRVTAARHAVDKALAAGHDPAGATAYSDSFFPFPDGLLTLTSAGVRTVLTCSGSVNDEKVIAAARDSGATLCMIPHAKARGFFGH